MIFQHLFSRLFKRKPQYHGDHTWSQVPHDVGVYIMSFMTFKEVLTVSLVSRHYYQICGSDMLWEEFCAQKWKYALNMQLVNTDYASTTANGGDEAAANTADYQRRSMGDMAGDTLCLSEPFNKKFLETLRKNYNDATWKEIYLRTLLV